MSLRLRWMLASAALVAVAVPTVRPARAAAREATEPIRIEYRAEPGCPSADEFNAQVFRRTASARLANNGDSARTFVVSIERRGSGLTGSLVIRQADGKTESREVAGPDCGEVATVLALATALAIDPQASLSAEPSAQTETETEPLPPPLPPADSHPGNGSEAANPPSDEVDSVPAPWGLAIGPSLEAAVAPRVALGGTFELAWRAPGGGGPISALGIDLTYLRTPPHSVATASSSFQFIYARPSLCSVALRWQSESGIAPCLATELGAVTGYGTNIPHTSTRTRIWSTVDIGLRLFQTLGRQWFIEAEGSVVLPITRYHFVFLDPETTVYTVPSAASAASIRVGARLW